jgi:hypothetical protein
MVMDEKRLVAAGTVIGGVGLDESGVLGEPKRLFTVAVLFAPVVDVGIVIADAKTFPGAGVVPKLKGLDCSVGVENPKRPFIPVPAPNLGSIAIFCAAIFTFTSSASIYKENLLQGLSPTILLDFFDSLG